LWVAEIQKVRPSESGPLRTVLARGETTDHPILWVDVSADGAVSQGEGVPGWWQGEPQGY
jgi:hypothetical protein